MSAGGAAIDRLLDKCWSDMPIVIDGEKSDEDKESSEWELSATKLIKRYFKQLKEADRRNLVGHYSALILQVRDGKAWDEPVDDLSLKSLKDKGIVKLIPVWEIQLKVIEWDTDEKARTTAILYISNLTKQAPLSVKIRIEALRYIIVELLF